MFAHVFFVYAFSFSFKICHFFSLLQNWVHRQCQQLYVEPMICCALSVSENIFFLAGNCWALLHTFLENRWKQQSSAKIFHIVSCCAERGRGRVPTKFQQKLNSVSNCKRSSLVMFFQEKKNTKWKTTWEKIKGNETKWEKMKGHENTCEKIKGNGKKMQGLGTETLCFGRVWEPSHGHVTFSICWSPRFAMRIRVC